MSIATHVSAATLAAVALSVAGLARADQFSPGTLLWDCARDGAPSLGQVKQLFDTGNNAYASTLRLRLQAQLRAACRHGTDQVLFVLHRPVEEHGVTMMAASGTQHADQ